MILLLSTSDTDLLSARAGGADYRLANPARLDLDELPGLLRDVPVVVVRILGTERTWEQGLRTVRESGAHVVVLGGEQTPDAELMALSTVPAGTATEAHAYLAHGGPDNLTELHRFLSDTLLLTGEGFAPPVPQPSWGHLPLPGESTPQDRESPPQDRESPAQDRESPVQDADSAAHVVDSRAPSGNSAAHVVDSRAPSGNSASRGVDSAAPGGDSRAPSGDSRPVVGIIYYRAHHLAGNTAFVETLAEQVRAAGGRPMPIFCASLRSREPEMLDELRTADVLLVTVLAAGGTRPAGASAGGDDESWDVADLAELDVPTLQAMCLTSDRATWEANDDGLSPMDAGNQMAVPEFDGRLITVPFSFKETDADGLPRYVPDAERAARVAGIALAHARLRHTPPEQRRVALMLSAYPTKHARVGNAVGLDTPASAVELLRRMHARGYDFGPDGAAAFPGVQPTGTDQPDGDALIHALIEAGGQDPEWLTEEQLAGNPIRVPAQRYREWFDALPAELREAMIEHWGPPPGELYVDNDEIVLASLRAGNVILMIQPPRGFGENPVAIYHDPDLPPTHHYLATYRWLAEEFGAHAVVHLGKHGSLEWLSGKSAGLSAACAPDAVLGDLPMIYPFLVNDPGEGAQAKRRAHATIVDHLVPPMARAESYGDMAKLEQLLDEHANIAAMDPPKLPAIRQQIWTLIQAAKLDHDLGITERPHDAEFDDFLLHVDGWLCEVKDAQIRDGLHVLGAAPTGEARVNLVLAMLRAQQIWGGTVAALPGLRSALGLADDAP
ncbi:cobaltochelatase subunit CobN, partial [Saccharomonospora iraqiensis]|uniref:cobaltochelatase subunit CobN n=1 Tax=Saccharomonospora iraqiensis TaxID=52698 RepID=UPI00054DF056